MKKKSQIKHTSKRVLDCPNFVIHCSRCSQGQCVPNGDSYRCKCSEGYQGQYCDRQQEPPACRGQHCGNGECRLSESGAPFCHCQPGYTGPTCDTGKMMRTGIKIFP